MQGSADRPRPQLAGVLAITDRSPHKYGRPQLHHHGPGGGVERLSKASASAELTRPAHRLIWSQLGGWRQEILSDQLRGLGSAGIARAFLDQPRVALGGFSLDS